MPNSDDVSAVSGNPSCAFRHHFVTDEFASGDFRDSLSLCESVWSRGLNTGEDQVHVSLTRAPDIFFDPHQWAEFVAYFPNPEVALVRISRPPDGPAGFYEPSDLGVPQPKTPEWQRVERLFRLGLALVGELKRKLLTEELIATGVPLPQGDRIPIPPEEWNRLWPSFEDGCAYGPLQSHFIANAHTSRRRI